MSETNDNQSPLGAAGAFIWDLVKILVIALVIIIPFRIFIAEPFVVSGPSMLPNFKDRDYLIVDRITYRFSEPQRGDVIVLRYPKDPSQYFIKRLIGLPGDKVCFTQGQVYIYNDKYPDGLKLNESYLPSGTETMGQPSCSAVSSQRPLGSNEYYVLGDNRTASSDSRAWGILPGDDIVGKVWLRVLPISKFGFIKTPSYSGKN